MPDFAPVDDLPPGHVHPLSREAWRAWLSEHHGREEGVWLVRYKQHTGQPTLPMKDIVAEAICWGWIDSSVRKVDDARSKCYVSPRKPGSSWSRVNKEVVARMNEAGLMQPTGLAKVEAAHQDGSWTRLDDVEDLLVPDDLAAAFEAHPGSADHWEGFPRSVKRGILEWILNAKRAPTRATRIEETARLAQQNKRANQWPREG